MASLSRSALTAIGAGCLVIAGAATYAGSLHGPFVYDDVPSILGNASIRQLGHLGAVLFPPGGSGFTYEGRPLVNLSLALNYALGGTSVTGYHLVNVLIHLLAGLLVFGLVRRTLETRTPAGLPTPLHTAGFALVCALLWTLHPLQTESVTYVIQRAESLVGLFYLAAFYAFARYAGGGDRGWALLCVAATWLGTGAKELMVTAPVMLWVYDRTFFAGSFSAALKARGRLYAALAASWIPLAVLILANGGNRGGSSGFGSGVDWADYVRTQPEAICRYLALSFWPSPLVFDYGPLQRTLAQALPYALVVGVLGAASVWALVRRPVLGFFGFWVFGILAVTSLWPGNSEMIVEHRMYLPLLAIVALAALLLVRFLGNAGFAVAGLVVVAFGALTFARNRVYGNDLTLWKESVTAFPRNSRGWANLGVAYYARGQSDLELAAYEKALEVDPRNYEAQHSLANALFRQGRAAEALAHYQTAIEGQPKNARLRADVAADLSALREWPQAIAQAQASLALDPGNAKAHDTLGVGLVQTGQVDAAQDEFMQAIRLDPTLVSAHANLGYLYGATGRFPEAEKELELALKLNPALGDAEFRLGNIFLQEGRFYEAARAYQSAQAHMPPSADLLGNLGEAILRSGHPDQAIPGLEAAARAHPDSRQAHHDLAAAYEAAGRAEEARKEADAEASSHSD